MRERRATGVPAAPRSVGTHALERTSRDARGVAARSKIVFDVEMTGRSSRGAGLAALAWLIAEVSGCGSEVRGPIGEDEFASEFAHAFCTNMGSCCASAGFPHQEASCETTAREYFESYLAKQRTLAVDYDADAAARCLDAISNGLRSCTKLDNSDCEETFKGRLSPGQACASSTECSDQDGESANCDNGVCAVFEKRVGLGEACAGTCTDDGSSRECSSNGDGNGYCYTNDGFSCGSEGRCVPVPGIGEPCEGFTRCKDGAFCDLDGKCSPQRDTGSCTSGGFDACSDRTYCDFDSGECQPRKADGAECRGADECVSDSCDDATCRPDVPVDADLCAGRFGE
jgi:hypothetical protein